MRGDRTFKIRKKHGKCADRSFLRSMESAAAGVKGHIGKE